MLDRFIPTVAMRYPWKTFLSPSEAAYQHFRSMPAARLIQTETRIRRALFRIEARCVQLKTFEWVATGWEMALCATL